jgi:hypothetical protein
VKRTLSILMTTAILMTACTTTESSSNSAEDANIYIIAITPALTPLWPALQTCDLAVPDAYFFIEVLFYPEAVDSDAVLVFRLGEPEELPAFSAPIAYEDLLLVTHKSNPTADLTRQQLRGIFTGRLHNWTDFDWHDPIQVWMYYDGDDSRQLLEENILLGIPLTPNALLAPGPQEIIESVADDPASISVIPAAFATNNVQTADLGIQAPILALANEEPEGAVRDLLVCLQGEIGQAALAEIYTPLK